MNYTTIEQSKKLLELGLNPKGADMCYFEQKAIITPYDEAKDSLLPLMSRLVEVIPCWSVGALLEVMPNIPDCTIIFAKAEGKYGMCTTPLDSGLALNEVEADTPIEAVYNMVIWLLENRYIKKGE